MVGFRGTISISRECDFNVIYIYIYTYIYIYIYIYIYYIYIIILCKYALICVHNLLQMENKFFPKTCCFWVEFLRCTLDPCRGRSRRHRAGATQCCHSLREQKPPKCRRQDFVLPKNSGLIEVLKWEHHLHMDLYILYIPLYSIYIPLYLI